MRVTVSWRLEDVNEIKDFVEWILKLGDVFHNARTRVSDGAQFLVCLMQVELRYTNAHIIRSWYVSFNMLEELRSDILDLREMYREQVNILVNKSSIDSAKAKAAGAEEKKRAVNE
ncbi:hypothetical protein Tco_0092675 [Tanacetum coccineum]